MSTPMRAKFQVASVERIVAQDGSTGAERVKFHAVCKSRPYGQDGLDEDNTFAKYSPSANCEIYIANQALFGKYAPGQKFYVDFTPAD